MKREVREVLIDGGKLRGLIVQRGLRFNAFAQKVGTEKSQVSRWTARGERFILRSTIEAFARVLGMDYNSVVTEITPTPQQQGLRDDEQDWLNVWRSLKPLQRSGLRLHVEEYVKKLSADEKHGGR